MKMALPSKLMLCAAGFSLLWQGVDPAVIGELYCFLLPQPGWNFLELFFWLVVHLFLSLFKNLDTNSFVYFIGKKRYE